MLKIEQSYTFNRFRLIYLCDRRTDGREHNVAR